MWSLMSLQGARPAMQMLVASKSYCIHPLFSICIKTTQTGEVDEWYTEQQDLPCQTFRYRLRRLVLNSSLEIEEAFRLLSKVRASPGAMVAGLGLLERISRIRDLWHGYAMFWYVLAIWFAGCYTSYTIFLHGWWFRRSKRVPLYSDVSIWDISIYFKTQKMYIYNL